jgi:hypothetical protein
MDRLTDLERTILSAICSQYPEQQEALERQVATARVCSREGPVANSDAGCTMGWADPDFMLC